jgi:hypothetical protein
MDHAVDLADQVRGRRRRYRWDGLGDHVAQVRSPDADLVGEHLLVGGQFAGEGADPGGRRLAGLVRGAVHIAEFAADPGELQGRALVHLPCRQAPGKDLLIVGQQSDLLLDLAQQFPGPGGTLTGTDPIELPLRLQQRGKLLLDAAELMLGLRRPRLALRQQLRCPALSG